MNKDLENQLSENEIIAKFYKDHPQVDLSHIINVYRIWKGFKDWYELSPSIPETSPPDLLKRYFNESDIWNHLQEIGTI